MPRHSCRHREIYSERAWNRLAIAIENLVKITAWFAWFSVFQRSLRMLGRTFEGAFVLGSHKISCKNLLATFVAIRKVIQHFFCLSFALSCRLAVWNTSTLTTKHYFLRWKHAKVRTNSRHCQKLATNCESSRLQMIIEPLVFVPFMANSINFSWRTLRWFRASFPFSVLFSSS